MSDTSIFDPVVEAALARNAAEQQRRASAVQAAAAGERQRLQQAAADLQAAQAELDAHRRTTFTRETATAHADRLTQLEGKVRSFTTLYQQAQQAVATVEQRAAQQQQAAARQRYEQARAHADQVERDGIARIAAAQQALETLSRQVREDVRRANAEADRLLSLV